MPVWPVNEKETFVSLILGEHRNNSEAKHLPSWNADDVIFMSKPRREYFWTYLNEMTSPLNMVDTSSNEKLVHKYEGTVASSNTNRHRKVMNGVMFVVRGGCMEMVMKTNLRFLRMVSCRTCGLL